jgi:hypothetical protein
MSFARVPSLEADRGSVHLLNIRREIQPSTVKFDGPEESPTLGAVGILLYRKRNVVVSGRQRRTRKTVPKMPKFATGLKWLA